MTTTNENNNKEQCPAQGLLKALAGKWKPEIFRLASVGPIRFNQLLREIRGSNKQSLTTALRELEDLDILERKIIQQKPLHVEYVLTEKGHSLLSVFQQLETLKK